jgi:hypothetical protein
MTAALIGADVLSHQPSLHRCRQMIINGVNALLRMLEKQHDDDPDDNRPADRRKKYDEYDG